MPYELQPDNSLVPVDRSMRWRQDAKRPDVRARSAEPPQNQRPPRATPPPDQRAARAYHRNSVIVPPTPADS